MSKGDNRRPSSVSKEEYDENFEALFGKKKLNIWENPDESDSDIQKAILSERLPEGSSNERCSSVSGLRSSTKERRDGCDPPTV